MKYEKVKNLSRREFKRLCGVSQDIFEKMVSVVDQALQKKQKQGRPSKLSREDQVLMTLEHLKEDRSYFHIALSWGVHESTAYRIIERTKEFLIKSGSFPSLEKKQQQLPQGKFLPKIEGEKLKTSVPKYK